MKSELIHRLTILANDLDKKGFTAYADQIDHILLCLAMSSFEARALLGVLTSASPEEINKAFRMKALQSHPDVGGSTEKMQQLNIARDILLGERKEERPFVPPRYDRPPEKPRPRPEPVRISFDDALDNLAGFPAQTDEWLFKTDTEYSPYLGDLKTSGYVACGTAGNSYIFVGVFHKEEKNYFSNVDIDEYKMWFKTYPKDRPLDMSAREAIRELWTHFDHVKGWNGKVIILPPGASFTQDISYAKGRTTDLVNAIEILESKPISIDKKVDVVLELTSTGKLKPEYFITLIVNGRPFTLSETLSESITAKSNLLSTVFGTYYYSQSKKNITKMRNKRNILGYLVKKLDEYVEPELMNALKAAFEQSDSGSEAGTAVPPTSKSAPTSEQLRVEIERLREENERLRKTRR